MTEQIHFEALRKQLVIDRRNSANLQREFHQPPYQPRYIPYELPHDDKYFVVNERIYKCNPNHHHSTSQNQFTSSSSTRFSELPGNNNPSRFLSNSDIFGNSASGGQKRTGVDERAYSAKIKNRLNNMDYKSQW